MAAEFAGNAFLIPQHTIPRHFTNPDLNISLYSSLFSSSQFISLSTRECWVNKIHFRLQSSAAHTTHSGYLPPAIFKLLLSSSTLVLKNSMGPGSEHYSAKYPHVLPHRQHSQKRQQQTSMAGSHWGPEWGSEEIPEGATPATPTVFRQGMSEGGSQRWK